MRKDPFIVVSLVAIAVIYAASFFLPATRYEGNLIYGWEIFWAALQAAFHIWAPNLILWIGLMFLWFRRSYFAFALGGIATFLAGYAIRASIAESQADLWSCSGAYLWFASMAALCVAGLVDSFRPSPWPPAPPRHPKESYPELCEKAEESASAHAEMR